MPAYIDLLGDKLSKLIGKGLLPSKGLLRLALQDEIPDGSDPSYEQLKTMIQKSLPDRLKRLRLKEDVISNVEKELLSYLKINQSVILLANV